MESDNISIMYRKQNPGASDLSMSAFDGGTEAGAVHCQIQEDAEEVKYLEITGLTVIDKHRKKGIGSQLLERCLNAAKKSGADYALLLVKPTNQTAINLYKKFGFVYHSPCGNYHYYTKEPL